MTQPSAISAEIIDFNSIEGVDCPCGVARRALAQRSDLPFTLHRTQISENARVHYHRTLTETYYFLECDADAEMELDGERFSVRPGQCVVIPPLVRHRAIGRMTVLIVCHPKFDPQDEWFD